MFDFFKNFNKKVNSLDAQEIAILNKSKKLYISFDFTCLKAMEIEEIGELKNINFATTIYYCDLEYTEYRAKTRNISNSIILALEKIKDRIISTDTVSISLPNENVITKNIQVLNIEKYDLLINAEIKKYIPIPINEILLAKNKINILENSKLMFLCVVIQKTIYESYVNILKKYKDKSYFEINFFSFVRLIDEMYANKYNLCVHVSENCLNLILTKGKVVMSVVSLSISLFAQKKEFSSKYNMKIEDVEILFAKYRMLESQKSETFNIVKECLINFQDQIISEIKQSIISLEKEMNISIENLLYSLEVDLFDLENKFNNEFNNEIKISKIKISTNSFAKIYDENLDLNRYTHVLGLAKR